MWNKNKNNLTSKSAETQAIKSWLVVVLYLIGWESGATILDQSQSKVKRSNGNSEGTVRSSSGVSMDSYLSVPLLMEKNLRPTFSAATSVIWGHTATFVTCWRIRASATISTGLSNAMIDGYFAVFPRVPSWACTAVWLNAIHADPVILAGIAGAVIIIYLAVLTTVSLLALAHVVV